MNDAQARARWSLLFGNFVIGTGVLAPAGLINEISSAFAVDVPKAGSLIGYGAAVLCIEAPLLAFLTNRVDRRVLLTAALVLYVAGHLLSAFAPSFGVLLAIRLAMVAGAAIFTPQAASAIGLFIAPEHRAGSVAFIFLGWSVALAIGVPLVSLFGAHFGWSATYLVLGVASAVAATAVFATVPRGLTTPPLSVAAWKAVFGNRKVQLLLVVTCVFLAGQFAEYPFVAAHLKTAVGADPSTIAILFAVYGFAGVIGSTIAAAAIDRLGGPRTTRVSLVFVMLGLLVWSLSGTSVLLAGLGLAIWGSGGGPAIAAQQARLIAADPMAASATVALNTSLLYAGQAIGTSLGGWTLSSGHASWSGVAAVTLIAVALLVSITAQRRLAA
ncbi:MAG TPA: MFS transporter [Steroidobacteraceae bacterium]|jgi:MFS transporter, DHA1 family, inner membrane transport protein|nr:MFS transporter [Steroidobacteraceae bacterium]